VSLTELLHWPLFWLVVLIILVAQALLIISAARMRQPSGQPSGQPASATHTELGWTLATAAALFALLFFIYRALIGG
jgi:heme/copper-type cytochrome/quinol oxidase subunit 2